MFSQSAILAIDDEVAALQACRMTLGMGGVENVICCDDARQAMGILARENVGVVLVDLMMPWMSGQELLGKIAQEYPGLPVIVLTSANDINTAVACMREGAFDYMLKPVELSRLLSGVQRALEVSELRRACSDLTDRLLSSKLKRPDAFSEIVTQDPAMHAVFRCVEAIAVTSRPVLITGETGVGKELVARAIHKLSERPGKFVAVNIAGVDDHLFSDTLFGHKKGAYTGADTDRPGLIAEAAAGTMFLDEIGDLSPLAQIKLLRLIQEYEYMPLGTTVPESADVRVVVATHQDLIALQEKGTFRKDLYYRLTCHHIHIPPLRERKQDLPLLVDHLIARATAATRKKKPAVPQGLLDLLGAYSFPGNVRELESMLFDAISRNDSPTLAKTAFTEYLRAVTRGGAPVVPEDDFDTPSPLASWVSLPTLNELDALLVAEAMKRANGNQTVASRILGISQPALSKRLKTNR